MSVTMKDIEQKTVAYARNFHMLDLKARLINKEIAEIKKKNLPMLKTIILKVQGALAELKEAIDASRGLFERPRTQIFDGIKIGLQKQKGKITWDDGDKVVALIKKHFPEKADLLIHTEERPSKEALQDLSAADLKKLGVSVTQDSDEVLVKSTETEIDKLIAALLKEEKGEEA